MPVDISVPLNELAVAFEADLQSTIDLANGALGSVNIFQDTTAGLAATTSGEYFSVPSTESAEYLILYQNNSGVASEIKRYPSSQSINDLRADVEVIVSRSPGSPALVAEDEDGKSFLVVTEGEIRHPAMQAIEAEAAKVPLLDSAIKISPGPATFVAEDEDGKAFFAVTEADIKHPAISSLREGALFMSGDVGLSRYESGMQPLAAVAEIIHVMIYGQSLSLGENTQVGLSTEGISGGLMFAGNGNPVTNNGSSDSVNYASLVPLKSTATRETPAPGFAAMISQLLLEENGIDLSTINQQLLLSCPGEGGKRLQDLDKPSTGYTRLITGIDYGEQRAAELGKSYLHQCLYMIHGESDYDVGTIKTTPAEYESQFMQLLSDIKSDTISATSYARDPLVIWYQTSSHRRGVGYAPGIALKQIEMVEENSNFVFSTPVFPLPYSDDLIHLNNIGSMVLGAYGGLAAKRAMWDGIKTRPLLLGSPIQVGSNIVLLPRKYPGYPLVLDDQAYNPGNYGFSCTTAGGIDNPVIGVALSGPNAVKLTVQNAVSTGDKVQYAFIGTADYGCGCLRDSQGDRIVFRHAGVEWPMHNWAPIQELTVS